MAMARVQNASAATNLRVRVSICSNKISSTYDSRWYASIPLTYMSRRNPCAWQPALRGALTYMPAIIKATLAKKFPKEA